MVNPSRDVKTKSPLITRYMIFKVIDYVLLRTTQYCLVMLCFCGKPITPTLSSNPSEIIENDLNPVFSGNQ